MTDRKEDGTSKDGRVARGEITRERVLDAAERCFAELGFDAVSIRRIASALSPPTARFSTTPP